MVINTLKIARGRTSAEVHKAERCILKRSKHNETAVTANAVFCMTAIVRAALLRLEREPSTAIDNQT